MFKSSWKERAKKTGNSRMTEAQRKTEQEKV